MNDLIALILANIGLICPEITNTSSLSIFKKIANTVAITIYEIREEILNTSLVVQDAIDKSKYGFPSWYESKAKLFQFDPENPQVLVFDEETYDYVYQTVDETKRIVGAAVFSSNNNNYMTLKYAIVDADTGLLRKATVNEDADFKSYFLNFQIAGLPVVVSSNDPDTLEGRFYVYYDKKVSESSIVEGFEQALQDYSKSLRIDDNYIYTFSICEFLKNNVTGIINVALENGKISKAGDNLINNEYHGKLMLYNGYFTYSNTLDTVYVAI